MVAPEIFGSCSGTKRPPSAAYPANPLGIQDPKQLQHYLVMLYRYIYVQNYVATIDLFNSLYFKQIWHALNDIEPLYFTHTWVSRFLLWFHWEHLMLSVTLSSFTQISINVLKKKKHHEQHKIHHDLHFGKMTSSSSSANFTSLVNKNHSSLTNHSTFHHPVSFIPRTFRQRFGQAHPVGETTASAIEAHGVGFFSVKQVGRLWIWNIDITKKTIHSNRLFMNKYHLNLMISVYHCLTTTPRFSSKNGSVDREAEIN